MSHSGATQGITAPSIVCSGCQVAVGVAAVEAMDVSSLKGIEVAFRAHCQACDLDTWAVRGEAPSVRAFYATLEKATGQTIALDIVQSGPAS